MNYMAATTDQATFDAILRGDLASFVGKTFETVVPSKQYISNWHIEAIAWHLQQCAARKIKRLIITLPPRSLKSICTSVAYPAWLLGHDPGARIVCASYAAELSNKHANDCRAVIGSSWYRRVFPNTRIHPGKNTELEIMTTRRGMRLSTSVGGTLTGRGGNFIIIDDPLKPGEAASDARRTAVNDWYDGTLYSRLDNKSEDVIIIVMQRLHIDDLVGHVLQQEDWIQLNIPAIAPADETYKIGPKKTHFRREGELLLPERESREALDNIRRVLGSPLFSAQYQQEPVPLEGNLVRRDWLQFYEELPEHQNQYRIVQSWDTASKGGELNDYSVCTTWAVKKQECFLLDVFRKRMEYPELKRALVSLVEKYGVNDILIEDKGSGTGLIQDVKYDTPFRAIAITPKEDKVTRLSTVSAHIEAGYVHFPKQAPWLDAFLLELLQFPAARHDDQVDSMTQLLGWVRGKRGAAVGIIKLKGW